MSVMASGESDPLLEAFIELARAAIRNDQKAQPEPADEPLARLEDAVVFAARRAAAKRRREPTPEETADFYRRLGRWLADVAMDDDLAPSTGTGGDASPPGGHPPSAG